MGIQRRIVRGDRVLVGISMHMLAKIIRPIVGVNYHVGLIISAVIVLLYIFLGGLTSAISTKCCSSS